MFEKKDNDDAEWVFSGGKKTNLNFAQVVQKLQKFTFLTVKKKDNAMLMLLFLRNGSSEGGEQPKENDNEVSELQQKGNISVPSQPPLLLTMQRSLSPFIFERRFRPVYCYCLVLIGPGCGLENRETCKEIKIFSFPCIEK